MQPADRLIDNIASLATVDADGDFTVLHDAAIAIHGGHIEAVGPRDQVLAAVEVPDGAEVIDATGMSAVPGLVDCHTHVVYGGDRIHEFDLRAQGADYERIAAEGGGIKASVRMTREASDGDLLAGAVRRMREMLACGTTTAEVKSGYGLDVATEARMLRTAIEAGEETGLRVTTTCLALHSTPPEAASADAYVETAIAEILPACAPLADAADVFLSGACSTPTRHAGTCSPHGSTACACASTPTNSPRWARSRSRSNSVRPASTTSRRPAPTGSPPSPIVT